MFNSFLAKQCSIIDNRSEIPTFLNPKTVKSLSNITFAEKDIEKVIQNLDSNKAHGHDMISIRILKICDILNDQYSSWVKVEAGVLQGSVLAPLLFFIYINDLFENLASNPKLFADNTSLFSVVKNVDASNIDLNSDLKKIGEWAFQLKMNFNADPTKQAQTLIFSPKVQMNNHQPSLFNQNVVPQNSLQKHLGMFLDSKLNFSEQLKSIFQKTSKTIRLLHQTLLPRAPLIRIYKSFIRPYLDYGHIIHDQTFNMSFQQKMETIQYNAALATTGAIRGFSREKLYQ